LAGAHQLRDFSGRDVGRIVLFENIAPQRAALRASMIRLSNYFLIAAVLGLLGMYVYLKYVERLVGLFQDRMLLAIESRKFADEKHREEMLPFRDAFEGATDAIAIMDFNRRLRFVNKAFRQLSGYSLEELEIQGGVKTLYADPKVATRVFLKVSQGNSFAGEVEMHARDGRIASTYLRVNPIVRDTGEMIGILAVCTDITKLKKTERELRKKTSALVKCWQSSNDAEEDRESESDERAASGS
jgi:PAS domain S-box-containing protein